MSLRSRVEELSTRPYFTAPKMIERNDNDNFVVFQQPQRARAANSKDATERRAVDPPPVLKLQLSSTTPVAEDCTKYIALAVLMPASSWDHSSALELKNKQPNAMNGAHRDTTTHTSTAVGTWASAAYLLRSSEESEERHIFFIFPDLGVKRPGMFCIHFLLYERVGTMVKWLKSTVSNPFTVYSARLFPGVLESTMLSRIFVSQGVKIRLRNSQQTENQLPLKTEINNNPRLLPGRYLLAPSGIPADINRSSSSIATSMLLSSRDTSPIATSPIHYTQPASHTFADDKLLPTTKACLSSLPTKYTESYTAPVFLSKRSFEQTSPVNTNNYAKRARLETKREPELPTRNIYFANQQEAKIKDNENWRDASVHHDTASIRLPRINTQTTSGASLTNTAASTRDYTPSCTFDSVGKCGSCATHKPAASFACTATRLPPISSLYLGDWPSYDHSQHASRNKSFLFSESAHTTTTAAAAATANTTATTTSLGFRPQSHVPFHQGRELAIPRASQDLFINTSVATTAASYPAKYDHLIMQNSVPIDHYDRIAATAHPTAGQPTRQLLTKVSPPRLLQERNIIGHLSSVPF